jgi:peptidyl-prolyl cis-trans isomerase SurA
MLGKLLEDKLYAHQAIQDSVKVADAEVKGLLEEQRFTWWAKSVLWTKVVEY